MSPKAKLHKGATFSVGATHSPQLIELMGAGFAYVTPDTERAPELTLSVGHKVLVDYRNEVVDFGRGNSGWLALKVREYGPDAADVALWLIFTPAQRDGLLREEILQQP